MSLPLTLGELRRELLARREADRRGHHGIRPLQQLRALDAGVISINSNTSVRVSTPFGGFKQSGYGRELGPHALDAYTEVKSIYFSTT